MSRAARRAAYGEIARIVRRHWSGVDQTGPIAVEALRIAEAMAAAASQQDGPGVDSKDNDVPRNGKA